MKYCTNCGIENSNMDEMCKKCGGLIFVEKKPNIIFKSEKPNIFITILSFFCPLIGLLIATFSDDNEKRKRYRNFAILGILAYFTFLLINRCIVEQEFNKTMNKMFEEIINREQ